MHPVDAHQRVLIASPVRQQPAKLCAFLESLEGLDRTGLRLEFAFVDDNDDPESSALLRAFAPNDTVRFLPAGPPGDLYVTDDETHRWQTSLTDRVAAFKDRFLEIVRDEGFDAVFLVDSDLVLQPQTVRHLVDQPVLICSEVFWTRWEPGGPELPQVWCHGQYSLFRLERGEEIGPDEIQRRTEEFVSMLRTPGRYEVGGLGACTLVRREAIERGVRFARVPNLLAFGEDRDFCARAAALGIGLYVDTHHPPLHLYRERDLDRVAAFRDDPAIGGASAVPAGSTAEGPSPAGAVSPKPASHPWRKAHNNRIVLSMVVRNEAGRHLDRVLRHAASYVDAAVILDDASTDDTVAVCRAALAGMPHEVITLDRSLFGQEHRLRRLQWEHTLAAEPDWILNLDADEQFEDAIRTEIRSLVDQTAVDAVLFRLYDMWSATQYRSDGHWRSHTLHRPFLVRPVPGMDGTWPERTQHAGRFPPSVSELDFWTCSVRLKHLGWADAAARRAKYERYRELDPDGDWSASGHYASILDPAPTLVDFEA
ncbi:MAG: glycosyltransferase family 2 protein [Patulibacter sp.]